MNTIHSALMQPAIERLLQIKRHDARSCISKMHPDEKVVRIVVQRATERFLGYTKPPAVYEVQNSVRVLPLPHGLGMMRAC